MSEGFRELLGPWLSEVFGGKTPERKEMTDEKEEEGKTLGDTLGELYDKVKTHDSEMKGITLSFSSEPESTSRPWFGPGAGMGEDEATYMPHASAALLEIGDLLPPPPKTPTDLAQGEGEEPREMSEEEWLRELARRVLAHAEKFGGNDRQVRRELTLAARMLNGYAVHWEKRNEMKREHPSAGETS